MTSQLSIHDVADQLGVSTKTVRRLIARGELRASRLGGKLIRIDQCDVNLLLKPIPTRQGGDAA